MAAADIASAVQKPTYAAGAYWDTRYTGPAKNFDWFFNYPALKALLHEYLPTGRVLHVGCGNSNIQEGMAADGFTVTNVDISPVVIEQMKHQHAAIESMDYLVADCRDMSQLADCSFGSCIDKGTLDAVLCSQSGQIDAVKYLHEINRLLKPGGMFLLISLGTPDVRLALLQKQQWGNLQVLLLPKPLLYLQSDASMSGRPLPSHYAADKNEPVQPLGPWPAAAALQELASQELEVRHYFFAYLCTKTICEQAQQPPLPSSPPLPPQQPRQWPGQGQQEQQPQQPQQPHQPHQPQQQEDERGADGGQRQEQQARSQQQHDEEQQPAE